MKVIQLVILVLIINISSETSAQNFSVNIDHTEISGALGSEIIFEFQITNTSSNELTVSFVRSIDQSPEGWTSSLCFSYCFAPHLDSISTTAAFGSSPLQPDETREFSVHVFPLSNEGACSIKITIGNIEDPNEKIDFTLVASTNVTSVNSSDILQEEFNLNQNYPNPFNPSTIISYYIPESGYGSLEVFDVLGNSISLIKEGYFRAGFHETKFSAKDISSGVYFYRLKVANNIQTKRMIIGK